MALDTMEDVVSAGVEAHALIDKHLALAYKAARNLTAVTESGVELGMIRGIAAKQIIGDVRFAMGQIGAVASTFAGIHQIQTQACIDAGVDMGSVTTAGGIAIGGVGPTSGGR